MLINRSCIVDGIRVTQYGDEIIVGPIATDRAQPLRRHFDAAGFDGRIGGPIGIEEIDGHCIVHVHNATIGAVAGLLGRFTTARAI